jgi:hypothetical protein
MIEDELCSLQLEEDALESRLRHCQSEELTLQSELGRLWTDERAVVGNSNVSISAE